MIAPADQAALADELARASAAAEAVNPIGGGTRSRIGRASDRPATDLSTAGLNRLVDHQPADLTITAEAGMPVAELQALVGAAGQWWPQAEVQPGSTIGGVIATAASGRGRLRFGAVRDSLLETVVATGDGRIVKAGGRTVKGVAGFDIPRLLVGSLGTLGVIAQVTLKLWPRPVADSWFTAGGTAAERSEIAEAVIAERFRSTAVVVGSSGVWVWLTGHPAEVIAPAGMLASEPPPDVSGLGLVRIGVPPTRLADFAEWLDARGLDHELHFGVGSGIVAVTGPDDIAAVRAEAIARRGHAVVIDGPPELRTDPWGPPPAGLAIMRRLRDAFDPAGILSPGRFVGDAA